MAVNGTSVEFRIPQEPLPVPFTVGDDRPIPFVGSDEESFVVLGKSLVTDFDDLSLEDDHHLGKSIIQEAKELIRSELDKIEKKTDQEESTQEQINNIPENPVTKAVQNGLEASTCQSFHSTSSSSSVMDRSSVLPAMPQPKLYPRIDMDGNDVSRTISIISFAPSEFASEELQTKVTQLIEENVHLKDTILQNNMSMKAQYEKIVAWQRDVEKVHESHKEKFRQAKQCIETLKKENIRLEQKSNILQEEIENLRCSLKVQQSEHNKTKQILTQSSETNLKEFELDIANKRIKELEETLKKMEKKSNDEPAGATSKWKSMEEKLVRYEKELEEAYKKNRELEKTSSIDNSLSYVEKLKVTEEKLILAEMASDQANKEILSLRNQLAKNLQITEESPKLMNELEVARSQITELKEMLISRNATLIDANMRSSKMEESLSQASDKIRTMDETMIALQTQLEETKIEVWKHKQTLSEKETQLQMLEKEREISHSQKQACPQNSDEIAYLRQQLMQSQMAMTQCDQSRAVAYAQLETQKNEIADLRRQLDENKSETDAMFAIRTQLDVYKSDFEAEREAKEDIKRDKNKMSEDLQHLHRRNQQLQEEIELHREQLKQYGGMPRTRQEPDNNQGASGWSSSRNQPIYKCPKCQFGFQTLNAAENHVVRCIELDDSLP